MNWNDYQKFAISTYKRGAVRENLGDQHYLYPALGLVGEAGEVAEKVKKAVRDDGGLVSSERQQALKKELGDVLWYVTVLADSLGLTLEEVMQGNVMKLSDRQVRDAIGGDGDDR